jgi:hypothetical protein
MTIEKIVWYVQHTPHNTNRAVLEQMLKDLILSHGGTIDPDGPDGPDVPSKDVIYDGGIEE